MHNCNFTVIMEKDEPDGYLAYVPSLPGCYSWGSSKKEAKENICEAITGYIELVQQQKKKTFQKEVFVESMAVSV